MSRQPRSRHDGVGLRRSRETRFHAARGAQRRCASMTSSCRAGRVLTLERSPCLYGHERRFEGRLARHLRSGREQDRGGPLAAIRGHPRPQGAFSFFLPRNACSFMQLRACLGPGAVDPERRVAGHLERSRRRSGEGVCVHARRVSATAWSSRRYVQCVWLLTLLARR